MGNTWQELRDRRLLGEYQELMEFSERSPLVKIEPADSNFPPAQYLVTYNCLGYTDSSMAKTTTGHKVRIILPANYPKVPPIFQYESKVWAPSFFESFTAREHDNRTIKHYICIGHIGTPKLSLRTFVIGVGHMIQLRRDAGNGKPLDTRSLEGQDFEEITVPPQTQDDDLEINFLARAPATTPTDDFEIIVIDPGKDRKGNDLDKLIRILP